MPKPDVGATALLDPFHITDPPVPVETIARNLGVFVVRDRLRSDISGMLYREGDRTIIGLNDYQPPLRQRFTIAHELAHLTLHPGRAVHVDRNVRVNFRDAESGKASRWEEIEANAFAAELLMPRSMVQRAVRNAVDRKINREDQLIAELSKIFDVSRQAMELRLVNLGVIHPPA